MAQVTYTNVNKYFGDTQVLYNIDLEIWDGEFIVLVGPSGCGKSTTLRLLAGLEEISSGEISINGKTVNEVPPKNRDIAMVFQNYALYPHMNVFDNMGFGLKLRKYDSDEIESRVHDAAEILGITDLLERKPKALSGGQRQRVALGRAIVRQPKVFLFDEPLSNLDAKLRVQMRTEIKKLHSQLGTTMVYVTHDQTEAMTMGDRICVMKDGVIHQVDAPLDVYSTPADRFVAGFIGSPSMNFMPVSIEKGDNLTLNEGDLQFAVPDKHKHIFERLENEEIILGVRPEDIYLAEDMGKSDNIFELSLEVSEPMGSEIYIYFDTSSNHFVGRISGHMDFEYHQKISIGFDMESAHYFDRDSGKRLN